MAKSELDKAQKYLKRRNFSKVISLLEPLVYEYRDSFRFFYTLGISCLYLGDIKGAETYFNSARHIKANDVNLILAQAIIFLRKGKIDRALGYCLDALDLEPNNKYALRFLEMIRKHGNPETISEWTHNGKLKDYYPPLPKRFNYPVLFACICVVCCAVLIFLITMNVKKSHARLDPKEYAAIDKSDMLEQGLSKNVYHYVLTTREAEDCYKKAREAINNYDDNEAQKYINKILNSNCSAYVIDKAKTMQEILVSPTFESKFTNYSFLEVQKDVYLYEKCWVIWKGYVTNIVSNEEKTMCDLYVGDEEHKKVDGKVRLLLSSENSLSTEKPIKVLGQIFVDESGILILNVKSVYQPLTGNKL